MIASAFCRLLTSGIGSSMDHLLSATSTKQIACFTRGAPGMFKRVLRKVFSMSKSDVVPISTRDLSELPSIDILERISQSLAMLDAILSPEWDYRYFSFNAKWDPRVNERMASMRNGSGDEYFLLFTPAGAIMKGFDHESVMSPWKRAEGKVWPGVLDAVPAEFSAFLSEPAFKLKDTTFCIWRSFSDSHWKHGSVSFPGVADPDGSGALLCELDGNPATYIQFAKDCFEKDLPTASVGSVFRHEAVTTELVASLNPDKAFEEALSDAEEIGYPV